MDKCGQIKAGCDDVCGGLEKCDHMIEGLKDKKEDGKRALEKEEIDKVDMDKYHDVEEVSDETCEQFKACRGDVC